MEMYSEMDIETKTVYSKEFLDEIRSAIEIEEVRRIMEGKTRGQNISKYFIQRIPNQFPLGKTLDYFLGAEKRSVARAKDIYVLYKGIPKFLSTKTEEIAIAFHYTKKSESWHAPGRTRIAAMLGEELLEEIVNYTEKKNELYCDWKKDQNREKK